MCIVLSSRFCPTSFMKIYLLRHAQAAPAYPDASRPLTQAGLGDVRRLAKFLKSSEAFHPDLIWRSPYRRAVETTEQLLAGLGDATVPVVERSDLTPNDRPESLLADLASSGHGDLLLVGHNPHLSILAALLLSGEARRVRLDLQTCNLVCLEWFPVPNHGQMGPCVLQWVLDPRLLPA